MSERTVEDALRRAEKVRGEIPHLVQPESSAYDLVALADEVKRLRAERVALNAPTREAVRPSPIGGASSWLP